MSAKKYDDGPTIHEVAGLVIFLARLSAFTDEVAGMPRFKGQAQAVRALKRIASLGVFR